MEGFLLKESYIEYIRNMVGDNKIILNSTAVIISDKQNRILLQRRTDNGLWGLPGGLLEMDETISEGAIREVFEETNLKIEITKFIGVFVNRNMVWHNKDKATVYAFGFVGKVISGKLKINDEESLELKYFNKNEIPLVHSIDNQRIIEAYYENRFNLVEGVYYDEFE